MAQRTPHLCRETCKHATHNDLQPLLHESRPDTLLLLFVVCGKSKKLKIWHLSGILPHLTENSRRVDAVVGGTFVGVYLRCNREYEMYLRCFERNPPLSARSCLPCSLGCAWQRHLPALGGAGNKHPTFRSKDQRTGSVPRNGSSLHTENMVDSRMAKRQVKAWRKHTPRREDAHKFPRERARKNRSETLWWGDVRREDVVRVT